ncbi:flagellar biosynthetic protein FliO [Thermosulfurimonas marina]|uniref:Flagellar biosynthetic protein FliO n=1 Tax=Thermosulfurimonas marina TaxID=2047767 RepID=A0A6H1WQT7_9BACT|nr:flagellar biosynthetic protein FliO [Thermosulfurimonas marina]QJA05528.1 flagellar biosynthetic protein FliO [Thermosulfurimonas marina]
MGPEVYLRVLGITLLLVGLVVLAAYLLRRGRWGLSEKGREIRVEEMRPLGLKHRLALVRVRGRVLLLGLSEKGITLLRDWEDEKD